MNVFEQKLANIINEATIFFDENGCITDHDGFEKYVKGCCEGFLRKVVYACKMYSNMNVGWGDNPTTLKRLPDFADKTAKDFMPTASDK